MVANGNYAIRKSKSVENIKNHRTRTMNILSVLLLAVFWPYSSPQITQRPHTDVVPDEYFPGNLPKRFELFKDAISGTPALIKKHGYPVESHITRTTDGYRLTMQRIPHGLKNKSKPKTNLPIIILPGLACNPNTYVGLNDSIAYYLADKGYDVWLGNHRGNIHYSRHDKYSILSEKFWDFSWEEMGHLDIPAKIDHILKETGEKKVIIISYSMSGAAALAFLSNEMDYNTKVARHIALGPVAVGYYQTSVLITLALPFYSLLMFVYNISINKGWANYFGFLGLSVIGPAFCLTIGERLCQTTFNYFLGYSPEKFGHRISMTVSDVTGGSSFKCFLHLMQQARNPIFSRFDYGRNGNLKKYGTVKPPAFNLSQTVVPTSIIYAANDPGASSINTELIARDIPNVRTVLIEDKMFNHASFVWSVDTNLKEYVNQVLLDDLRMAKI